MSADNSASRALFGSPSKGFKNMANERGLPDQHMAHAFFCFSDYGPWPRSALQIEARGLFFVSSKCVGVTLCLSLHSSASSLLSLE